MKRLFLPVAGLALFASGCGDALQSDAPTSPRSHAVDFLAYGTNAEFAAMTSEAERQRIYEQNVALFDQIELASGQRYTWYFRSERPLAEKDAVAEGLLAAHTGVEWIFARQKVAIPLLELHLRTESGDLDAIERYTRVLLETQNPSADLLSRALAVLGDRIDAEERAEGVASTRAAAQAWLAQVDCDRCAAAALRTDSEAGGLPRKIRDVRDGLAVLADLHSDP